MAGLSISRAWEETRRVLAHDGRLVASVALAMIAFPAALSALVNPRAMSDSATPMWIDVLVLLCSLVVLSGQLALIRLALAPSITVGAAIAHGFRRMPIYLLAAILVGMAMLIAAIPFFLVLVLSGVSLAGADLMRSPVFLLLSGLYLIVLFFVGVRMIMSSPAASAEPIGPIEIIRRSWHLTHGHGWALFGFLVLFFVGAAVLLIAVSSALGSVVTLLLGPVEPMSLSALLVALADAIVQAIVTSLLAIMLARIYAQLSGGGGGRVSVPRSGT